MLGNWKVKPLESYTTGKGLICLAETESVHLKFDFMFLSKASESVCSALVNMFRKPLVMQQSNMVLLQQYTDLMERYTFRFSGQKPLTIFEKYCMKRLSGLQ